ncbi:heavy-metal-associated domain-containing protein [Pseudonocardia sp. C8]|uniref:Heavy-metal-associated domain-containing protein n=1 Tax=Saccharopolyspora cebuensis TaxID=418759 RepID=A0ABV4CN23_9PSEU|nr:heavy-metal-associated domain-containing protein [Pseudonocardia sp. C8]MBC3193994.1 heavy-metal-associated domain-containing protein [Pseudonocardia sp. C8]
MRKIVIRSVSRTALIGTLLVLIAGILLGSTAHAGATEQATLTVDGMACPNCERTVEAVLRDSKGVQTADADSASQQARVTFDPTRTSPDALAHAINTQTYYRASTARGDHPAQPPAGNSQDQAGADNTGSGTIALLVTALGIIALAGAGLFLRRAQQPSHRQ